MDIYKLRIKHPSGAEFEAQGPENFILNEKREFLNKVLTKSGGEQEYGFNLFFGKGLIALNKENIYTLKAKYPQINSAEAAILILAANQSEGKNKELSAINLSKTVKASGYKTERLDRLLSGEIRQADIIASGTKRNRFYALSPKGMEKANLIVKKVLNLIGETPR